MYCEDVWERSKYHMTLASGGGGGGLLKPSNGEEGVGQIGI